MRRVLAAAALAVAGAALPAGAAPTPPNECYTYLLLAARGTVASCGTLGGTPLEQGTSYRKIDVAVQTGAVHAKLWCPLGTAAEADVAAPFTWSAIVPVTSSSNCFVEITALFDRTTAVATNTWGRYEQ